MAISGDTAARPASATIINLSTPELIEYLDAIPDVYASTCIGDCLEPIIAGDSCLVFSKSETPHRGDFVGLWLKPESCRPGDNPRMVKRLALEGWPGMHFPFDGWPLGSLGEPAIIVEMLNPPRQFQFRAANILAMHKVIGLANDLGDGVAQYRPSEGLRGAHKPSSQEVA